MKKDKTMITMMVDTTTTTDSTQLCVKINMHASNRDTKRWLELAITWNKLTPKTWKQEESSQVEAVAAQGKLRLLKSRAAFLSMDFKNLSWDFWAPAKLQELKHKELPN